MNIIINIILLPLFLIYLLIVSIRNYLYDSKIFKSTKLPCKVISVGNITTGGTGKTPTVIAIAKYLQLQKMNVAILSRGYGRKSKGTVLVTDGITNATNWVSVGDEPTLMAKHLSDIPIVVDENRVHGGQYLVENYNPEIILLDDGFQHRKLFRDIDIVLINSNITKFVNRILSFGNFREPWSSLKRSHIIFLTKSNIFAPSTPLMSKLEKFDLPLFKTNIISTSYILDKDYNKIDIDNLDKKSALLFSGIGDHESFENLVKKLGFKIVDSIYFRDHHNYSKSDIEKIRNKFDKINADIILTTEKDIIKIDKNNLPIFSVPISINIDGEGYKKMSKLIN